MTQDKTISITGGTGHLGICLIQILLKQGYYIKALYFSTTPQISHPNLFWIQGSVLDQPIINNLISDTSTTIHCASVISLGNQDKKKVYNFNVKGTEVVIQSCIKYGTELIHISSTSAVHETKKDEIFNEDRPYKTQSDFTYPWTKALSEQLVLSAVQEKKLKACIFRPSSIVGPPDYNPSIMGQSLLNLSKSKLPFITKGGYNMIDVRDLSITISNCIPLEKNGAIYLVTGNYFSMKSIMKILKPNTAFISIPIELLLVLLPLIKLYALIGKLDYPITKESLLTLKRAPKIMDSTKAQQELNHQIRPIEETINDLLKWFKKEQQL